MYIDSKKVIEVNLWDNEFRFEMGSNGRMSEQYIIRVEDFANCEFNIKSSKVNAVSCGEGRWEGTVELKFFENCTANALDEITALCCPNRF